jgi:hypothetical protein
LNKTIEEGTMCYGKELGEKVMGYGKNHSAKETAEVFFP